MTFDPHNIIGVLKLDVADPNSADGVVATLLERAASATPMPLDSKVVDLAVTWWLSHPKESTLVEMALAQTNANQLEELFCAIADQHPEAVAVAVSGSIILGDRRGTILEGIARDPRPDVREHLFALLGRHRRLVPPGSITVANVDKNGLDRILSIGLADPVDKVRERAIALAYATGTVESHRDEICALASNDPAPGARQYALVALGLLGDSGSRSQLVDRLEHGDQAEATSALWALARRPDGISRVLELAGDDRQWIVDELVNAVAEVAAPLSDAQLDHLREQISSEVLGASIARHIDRTRRGAPEVGPDGRVSYTIKSR